MIYVKLQFFFEQQIRFVSIIQTTKILSMYCVWVPVTILIHDIVPTISHILTPVYPVKSKPTVFA